MSPCRTQHEYLEIVSRLCNLPHLSLQQRRRTLVINMYTSFTSREDFVCLPRYASFECECDQLGVNTYNSAASGRVCVLNSGVSKSEIFLDQNYLTLLQLFNRREKEFPALFVNTSPFS
jgi:hypothetical protein